MRDVASNELGPFSLHMKVQVCFESEASLDFAVGALAKKAPCPIPTHSTHAAKKMSRNSA